MYVTRAPMTRMREPRRRVRRAGRRGTEAVEEVVDMDVGWISQKGRTGGEYGR